MIRSFILGNQLQKRDAQRGQDTLKLFLCSTSLAAVGVVMVASAAVALAEPYFLKHLFFCFIGILAAGVTFWIPSVFWSKRYMLCGLFAYISAALVFVPGLGHSANGATRWLNLGFFNLQVSELGKFFLMFFIAGILQKFQKEIDKSNFLVIAVLVALAVYCLLIIQQPDLGSAAVIFGSCLALFFIAGMKMKLFWTLGFISMVLLLWFIITEPFRLERLFTFINPWQEPYDAGYQLVQALIAFGRANWFGVGLGEGVQKLYYLPEAHNDFIFSVIVEELGVVGALFLILLYSYFVWLILKIAKNATARGDFFDGYCGFFAGFLFAFQFFINVGVNSGLLPTKGLTLPLISYGGSSLVTSCMMLGFLMRTSLAKE